VTVGVGRARPEIGLPAVRLVARHAVARRDVGDRPDEPAAEGVGTPGELEQRDRLGVREGEAGPGEEPRQTCRQMLLDEVAAPRIHHTAVPVPVGREPHAGIPVGVHDRQAAARPEDPRGFADRARHVVNIEVDLDGGDEVEGRVREIEAARVTQPDLDAARESLSRDPGPGRLQHLRALVDTDDMAAGPDLAPELHREEGRPASHVEASLTGARAQHRARPSALGRDRGRRVD
jgi:hypothetical protein